MAWQDELIPIVRVLINDLAGTPTYDDDRLEQLLLVACRQVNSEMTFDQDFVINVGNGTLLPDPTIDPNKNDSFINLVTQKAACILDQSVAVIAAKQAISVKDGASAIDLRGVAKEKIELLKQGWCAVYRDTKFEYQTILASQTAGAAIMTPFRLYAFGMSTSSVSGFPDGHGRFFY